ncbi:hypothetical protein LG634_20855 [Streptomyces bambusae]|uniref:hypothetical protein n=1 Tax=Streptomyces bambusae TaxID=1550616 RepID=UPI001CFC8971|nr:hypothetical protein [Streptomyces bambusae]MCB5167280.1 hypothetical protein [Streptomyces bambusae]
MLSFAHVYALRLAALHQAVADWRDMAARLDGLAADSRRSLLARADAADWRGANAEVTRPFVAKTAKEFGDAAAAAHAIRRVLEQGHTAFRTAQDQLRRIVETDAPAARLVVDTGTGRVRARSPLSAVRGEARNDPGYADLLRREAAAIAELERRIAAIVETCDDADQSVARALRADVSADGRQFVRPRFDSLDAEEAARAAALAARGRALTHAELVQLNELLRDNRSAPAFATAFYTALGARGALEFFGRLATDTYDRYGEQDAQRLADVRELQRNLGTVLAVATDPDRAVHLPESFARELRRLGTERIPLARWDANPPFGYQLLGGIMRYGEYDPRFLLPVVEHAVQVQAAQPDFFAQSRQVNGWASHLLNPSGLNGSGYDPVNSFLEALGHSPEAAARFFDPDRPPTSYAPDGTPRSGPPDLGRTADGEPVTSYLDYFTNEKYRSFPDTESPNPSTWTKSHSHMPDALGHALEAAVLGHAWDDPHPRLVRSEAGASVMEAVVQKYGEDPALLKRQEVLADSLGRMGAGYIDDINWGLNDREAGSPFAPADERGHARLGEDRARKFLSALGQHPEAYATVSAAERVYTASVMEAQVDAHGHIREGGVREAVRTGSQVQGLLDQARADQVTEATIKADEEYNREMEKRAAWVEFGATAAVGAGMAFLPITAPVAGAAAVIVPVAVDTGGGAMEELASQVVGNWSHAEQQEHQEDVDDRVHAQRSEIFRAGRETAGAPVAAFRDVHGIKATSDFAQDLEMDWMTGYNVGNLLQQQQGHAPETDE